MFQGLNDLYSIDLQGNRIDTVEPLGFAHLPGLRHLDIRSAAGLMPQLVHTAV